jgi:hypothetical protein
MYDLKYKLSIIHESVVGLESACVQFDLPKMYDLKYKLSIIHEIPGRQHSQLSRLPLCSLW